MSMGDPSHVPVTVQAFPNDINGRRESNATNTMNTQAPYGAIRRQGYTDSSEMPVSGVSTNSLSRVRGKESHHHIQKTSQLSQLFSSPLDNNPNNVDSTNVAPSLFSDFSDGRHVLGNQLSRNFSGNTIGAGSDTWRSDFHGEASENENSTELSETFTRTTTNNINTFPTQQEVITTPRTTNISATLDSANLMPRLEMGYPVTSDTQSSRQSSMKMERSDNMSTSERKEHEDDAVSAASTASATTMSPTIEPENIDSFNVEPLSEGRFSTTAVGTPSTVSTAPSTDDASFDHFIETNAYEKLSLRMDDSNQNFSIQPRRALNKNAAQTPDMGRNLVHGHIRSRSWDDGRVAGPNRAAVQVSSGNTIQNWAQKAHPVGSFDARPSRYGQADAWSRGQTRVASFRNDQNVDRGHQAAYQGQQVPHTEGWHQRPPYFLNQSPQSGVHLQSSGPYHARKTGGVATTPPRTRTNRTMQASHRQPSNTVGLSGGGANPPRSSSEVLKTLLRKKACLYEPETSRAVALVTWLVGRELALSFGYFSRQQLQSGVHACVAKKIDSGSITRTKVNRCMQIILNSCFQYIIPRPDGSEEKGDTFREMFAKTVSDDSHLCRTLRAPWNDITVNKQIVLGALSEGDKKQASALSPASSPRISATDSPSQAVDDHGDHGGKRAVLLCFNENVRSAEDVFLCHNEFIRDTANAAKLQLTAQEWRTFFGRDSVETPAWGAAVARRHEPIKDYLGSMKESDLSRFRTTWCTKRYDHDHDLCGFAHVEVNSGWLRRNPLLFSYKCEMCPSIHRVETVPRKSRIMINKCPHGNNCKWAHSREELLYHPKLYKSRACESFGLESQCKSGDICPDLHPRESAQFTRKPGGDARHGNQTRGNQRHGHAHYASGAHGRGFQSAPPTGAPMLYVSPAPFSNFDRHLVMPGLQSLFRRQSSVFLSQIQNPKGMTVYNNFGDDWAGTGDIVNSERGLPSPSHKE